jgi:hypothetical protein
MNKLYYSIFGLVTLAAALEGPLKAEYLQMNPVMPVIRYQDVLLDLLGEGRTMLARYLWFKMDLLHEQMDDQGTATFKQKEIVPLLRMINYLDPYFTNAYDTLVGELHFGYKQDDKAMELVNEGLLYTPDSFELNFRKALLAEARQDPVTAFQCARRALLADHDETHNLNALRTMYRACVRLQDGATGIKIIEDITRLSGGTNPYPDQYLRWKAEVSQ